MIRIDFGTLYEFEREDDQRRMENREKIGDFLSLCETNNATLVEQRDWNTPDLIHFVGISPHLVVTITVSDRYLAVQTSQIREKFKTFKADYVSVPDRQVISQEQPPADKLGIQDVIVCSSCGESTPYDGYFQHCVHCGGKFDILPRICRTCNNGVIYHPTFSFCPTCGGSLAADYDSPPLNELDPNALVWGIPKKESTEEGEDMFPGSGPIA